MRRKMPAKNTQNTEMSYICIPYTSLLPYLEETNYTDIGGLGYRVYI